MFKDEHTTLDLLVQEYGVDCHHYYLSLSEVWRTKEDIDFAEQNMLEAREAVLDYVKATYRRI